MSLHSQRVGEGRHLVSSISGKALMSARGGLSDAECGITEEMKQRSMSACD